MTNTHLSVIIPVYNSEGFIVKTLDELDEFIRVLAFATELVIVDDGSRDGTLALARKWAENERPYKVHVLACAHNSGKGAAVAKGMLASTGKFRIFLDADLAYPPSQILRILEALEDGNDVAVACRIHPDSRYTISPAFFHYLYTRHLASRLINWAMRHTIIKHCSDSQAGLKGFKASAAEKIFSRQIIKGFPFDAEAIFLAEKLGYRIREVPVEFRYFNEPTTVVFMQDGMSMARDVLRVRLNHFLGRYSLPLHDGKRQLIVNADDYGMTLGISRGILECIANGLVTTTSVMANSPEFEASMDEMTKANLHPDIGLHAVLTWGKPLTDPKKIPTLVDDNGNFLSRNKFLLRCLLKKINEEEVYTELRAQCERLSKRTTEISHLDGHHHVHAFPIVRYAAERTARDFGIKAVRSPREGLWSPWYQATIRRLVIALLTASHPSYWRSCGFMSTSNFAGFTLFGSAGLKTRWLNIIAALPHGTTEIMVHPGHSSECNDSYNEYRESELAILQDNSLKDVIHKEKIGLIQFKDIVR